MIERQYFLRSEAATHPGTMPDYGMSGLFSKLVKAVAKPFTKVFKPHTLFGKIADPLGLMSRNLKLTGRIADVVGTAASIAVGAYAIGAVAGGTAGGFWATAGSGAKLAAAKALAAGKGIGALAAGAVKAMGPSAAAVVAGGGIQSPATSGTPMFSESGAFRGSESLSPIGSGGPMAYPDPFMMGGAGAGGGGSMGMASDMPGATVPVEDTLPPEGPNWLVIGGITLAAAVLLMNMNKSKGR